MSEKADAKPSLREIFKELRRPFPASKIRWRIGSLTKDKKYARVLAYIDARDVMERLDEVVGPENWEDSYEDTQAGKETGVKCYLSLTIPKSDDLDKWANQVTKCDAASSTNIENLKGAYSDAFKRAAVKWGIGRDLYDLDTPRVPVKDGRYFDKKDIPRLPKKYYEAESTPKKAKKRPTPLVDDASGEPSKPRKRKES